MVSAISFKNFPTLVPPYFWTIQGKLVGFDFNDNCIIFLKNKLSMKIKGRKRKRERVREMENQTK